MLTLTVGSAPSLLIPNDSSDGFKLITVAIEGRRTYRITRQIMSSGLKEPVATPQRDALAEALCCAVAPWCSIDWFDFSVDRGAVHPGILAVVSIPYLPTLFTNTISHESSMPVFMQIPIGTTDVLTSSHQPGDETPEHFRNELFKLLCVSASVDDPIYETPSAIDFHAEYAVAGLPRKIRFVYYTVSDGMPVFVSCFGNVISRENDPDVPINPNKLVDVVAAGDIDYYTIRVTTTPNVITTCSILVDEYKLRETYIDNGVQYTLSAPGNGLTDNSFYAYLDIQTEHARIFAKDGFKIEPDDSIVSYSVSRLSDAIYKFVVVPVEGIVSMDLKITLASGAVGVIV